MKPLLIFLLLITSFALQAQTTVSVEIEAGPNSGLNIAQDYVEGMCECAKRNSTIRDIIERMLREKQGQIAYSQSLEEDIRSMYQKLVSYGGKNAKALSAEEFKIELERARKEGQLPETK